VVAPESGLRQLQGLVRRLLHLQTASLVLPSAALGTIQWITLRRKFTDKFLASNNGQNFKPFLSAKKKLTMLDQNFLPTKTFWRRLSLKSVHPSVKNQQGQCSDHYFHQFSVKMAIFFKNQRYNAFLQKLGRRVLSHKRRIFG
jgi:hypothetical protein